jgi:hypothetical protein
MNSKGLFPLHSAVWGWHVIVLASLAFVSVSYSIGNGQTISTVAGGGVGDGLPATDAKLYYSDQVSSDSAGNLYIVETNTHRIRKVDTSGTITTAAGDGTNGSGGDGGAATNAQLSSPADVFVDASDNIFIADMTNYRIRKVDTSGNISTVAGDGTQGDSGDGGPATDAQLTTPKGVFVDAAGNIFIVDSDVGRIRKVDTSGNITTIAGTGVVGYSGDGAAATLAQLSYPEDIFVDGTGNVFIADLNNHVIRKIDTSGNISTIAGDGTNGFSGDGAAATLARMQSPASVFVDATGNVFIADSQDRRVRKVDTAGDISTIAGNGSPTSGDGGPATLAGVDSPSGVYVSGTAEIYIASGERVRKVDTSGDISTFAGGGVGDGGAATNAPLFDPNTVLVDGSGNLFIPDRVHSRVRKVDSSGDISTVAGNGVDVVGGDGGSATLASLRQPRGLAMDPTGNLYIGNQHVVRRVDLSGNISTVAGTGSSGFSGDGGPATLATFNTIWSIAADGNGNIYISDASNSRIRILDTSGNVNTIAGTGTSGYSGDGGPATLADMTPGGIYFDGEGNLLITEGHRIRRVDSSGNIETIVGTGTSGFSGDGGPATDAAVSAPEAVFVDALGIIYLSDTFNDRIRKIGLDGIIQTVAGTFGSGFSGDGGAATLANLDSPRGISVDSDGAIWIADQPNNRIRKVDPPPRVSSILPTANNLGVSVTTNVVPTFTENMIVGSGSTFQSYGSLTGKRAGAYSGGGTATLTFDPTSDFLSGEHINVILTTGLQNTAGISLRSSQVVEFSVSTGIGPADFSGSGVSFASASSAWATEVADLDGDGDLDVAVGNGSGGQNAAYLNDGSGSFTAGTKNFGSGDETFSIAFADVDGDADMDVGVANSSAEQNVVYLNDGSGNFTAGTKNFGTGSDDSQPALFADLDGDGDLDVAVGNEAQQNVVYFNDGSGNFTAGSSNFGTGSDRTNSIAIGDVDGDGDLDIAAANHNNEQNVLYKNNGGGDFSTGSVNFGTGSDNSRGILLGDADGDGDLDAAVGNEGAQNVVYLGDNTGSFSSGTRNFGTGSDNTLASIEFGDVDGDGDLDLAVGNLNGQDAVYLNDGSANFGTSRNFGTGSDVTLSVALGDVDSDNDLDVIQGRTNNVYLNQLADPTVSPAVHVNSAPLSDNVTATFGTNMNVGTTSTFLVFGSKTGKLAGTYGGGGTPTLSLDPAQNFKPGEDVTVTLTSGIQTTGGASASKRVWSFTAAAGAGPANYSIVSRNFGTGSDVTDAVRFGDMDTDGDIDIASGNYLGQNVVYLNDGSGEFSTSSNFGTGSDQTQTLALGDADGDGDLDAAVGNPSTQNVVYLNDGSGNLTAGTNNFGTGTDWTRELVFVDADGDGNLDIAVLNNQGASNAQSVLYLGDGTGGYSGGSTNFGNPIDQSGSISFGDVDGDGDLDLAVGNLSGQNVIYLNNGGGAFSAGSINFGTGSDITEALGFGDADTDGDIDLTVGNSGQDVVYLNDGNGNFSSGSFNIGTGGNTLSVSMADADGDGDLDYAVGRNSGHGDYVHLNDGSGDPSAGSINVGSGNTESMILGDVDGDGDLDIAAANRSSQNKVYINHSHPTVTPVGSSHNVAKTTSLEATFDLNMNVGVASTFVIHRPMSSKRLLGTYGGEEPLPLTSIPQRISSLTRKSRRFSRPDCRLRVL